jgi:hypothetical protein
MTMLHFIYDQVKINLLVKTDLYESKMFVY